MDLICKIHGLTPFSDGAGKRSRCRKCIIDAVNKRRRKLKQLAVEYCGGKCTICGYSKCIGALHFHHVNPTTKNFSISSDGNTRSWVEIKNELDKCILVCANCHAELHTNE